jgi:hypothetical protein
VTILLYIVSGLFLLMAFGIMSSFFASRNPGLLLGGLAYGLGGAGALLFTSWWPLLVAFVVTLGLGFLGADPYQR